MMKKKGTNLIGDIMDYRALEDLIGILVKKAGTNISESKTMEDADILTSRKEFLESKKSELLESINNEKYIKEVDKNKDIEEKEYLENEIKRVEELDEEEAIKENELDNLNEQVSIIAQRNEIKKYYNKSLKENNDINKETLDKDINYVEEVINSKELYPSILGSKLLEAYKDGKSFSEVENDFNMLVEKATNLFNNTLNEVKDTNIFELMDEYSSKKSSTYDKLEKDEYSPDNADRYALRSEYHNSKKEEYNNTLKAISERKEELNKEIKSVKILYEDAKASKENNEKLISEYENKLYNISNISLYESDFNGFIDYLRSEILKDKYLIDKYNDDIVSLKQEIITLDINAKNIESLIREEEKCIEIVNSEIEESYKNIKEKIDDELFYLQSVNRLESLSNEQQYYYVNIDVIKNEILAIWNKVQDVASEEDSTMYEEAHEFIEENVVDSLQNDEKTPETEAAETAEEENTEVQEATSEEKINEPVEFLDDFE